MFKSDDINSSLVMALHDLDGFWHPLGFRVTSFSNKLFLAIAPNLVGFAAGKWEENPDKVDHVKSSYEEYLAFCQQFAQSCGVYQKDVVRQVIRKILEKAATRDPLYEGKPDGYCKPISKDNYWGKVVICLCLAFEVPLPETAIPNKEAA